VSVGAILNRISPQVAPGATDEVPSGELFDLVSLAQADAGEQNPVQAQTDQIQKEAQKKGNPAIAAPQAQVLDAAVFSAAGKAQNQALNQAMNQAPNQAPNQALNQAMNLNLQQAAGQAQARVQGSLQAQIALFCHV
jgi:hypothetical protein